MVLLRSSIRHAWPPKTETEVESDGSLTAREVVLNESIYWEYIRPFTPVEDRVVVSKRCTTRFYAGNRAELNETYLKKFQVFRWMDSSVVYSNIPLASGEPGTHLFHLDFGLEFQLPGENFVSDPIAALKKLEATRSAWDKHLSLLPTPSTRLDACLDVLANEKIPGSCSFLFDGKGDINAVVKFHASIDAAALNGPVFLPIHDEEMYSFSLGPSKGIFPNTQLGCWVIRFLISVKQKLEATTENKQFFISRLESIVKELLEFGADVGPFFQPIELPENKNSTITILSSIVGGFIPTGRIVMCDVMRRYMIAFSSLDDEYGTRELATLIDMLSRKSKIQLRFNVGDWVECNMGSQVWEGGVVTRQWSDGYVYEVDLEQGGAASPLDTDECIRRPELRFNVGDRVKCYVEEGWMPGTVTKQWSEYQGCPYEVVLDNYKNGEFLTAPSDWNYHIQALDEEEASASI